MRTTPLSMLTSILSSGIPGTAASATTASSVSWIFSPCPSRLRAGEVGNSQSSSKTEESDQGFHLINAIFLTLFPEELLLALI